MITEYELLRPDTLRILEDLSNPEKAVCKPLMKGKGAGKLDLIYQLFPPTGVHRNSIPANYTFVLEEWVHHTMGLMVSMVELSEPDHLIFGFIAHDQTMKIHKRTGITIHGVHCFAAVKYNPVFREGYVYLYNEYYAAIEADRKHSLDQPHESQRRHEAGTEYMLPGG